MTATQMFKIFTKKKVLNKVLKRGKIGKQYAFELNEQPGLQRDLCYPIVLIKEEEDNKVIKVTSVVCYTLQEANGTLESWKVFYG